MRILLINPASDFLTFKTHEVLGLGYLAAALDHAGHHVEIYDCNFQDASTGVVAGKVRRSRYEMVGLATMIGKTAHALRIAAAIGPNSGAFIVMGGYSATYEYDSIMNECSAVDCIVRGEGEEVLVDLAAKLENGEDWRGLASVVHREGSGVVANPMRALPMNLDTIKFPWRSPFLDRIGLASILSTRGCYAKCSFCNIQEFYNLSGYGGIRTRSAKDVVDEIELIHHQYGLRKFLFIDDDMLGAEFYDKGRSVAIASEILERGLKIEFEVAGRANDVIKFESALAAMKKAGLVRVYIGIESGSESQLKRQRKGVKVKHNLEALAILKRQGLGLDMGFIPFDPWSTPEETIDNVRFLESSGVMEAGNLNTMAVTTILYPGTGLYDKAKEEGLFVRAANYTYAYRFKHAEYEDLFTRIIYTIKSKLVLESVDRFVGRVKRDQEIEREADRFVNPAAQKLFSMWARLIERWCRGEEAPEVEVEIEAMEALIQNFCNSIFHLRRLGEALPKNERPSGIELDALESYTALREEIKRALSDVLEGCSVDRIPERWRNMFASDDEYMRLVWQEHQSSSDPAARRYYHTPNGTNRTMAVLGQRGRIVLPAALPAPAASVGSTGKIGLNVYTPPNVFATHMRRQVTSQIEKFDTTLRIGLEATESVDSGIKIYRGWNEVEIPFVVEAAGTPPVLVLTSPSRLEMDLQVGAAWWSFH